MIKNNKCLLSAFLNSLILTSAVYPPIMTKSAHSASVTSDYWGAGNGGNAGRPQPGDYVGDYGEDGIGGDGGGANGGQGGQLGTHIQAAATINTLLNGQNGDFGDIGVSNSQGGGGGGGGGTALVITDPTQQRFNVTINSVIKGGAGGRGGNGDFTYQLDGTGGDGGDGGSGIYGELIAITNNMVIMGGNGGNGGDSSGEDTTAGKGGNGGHGVILDWSAALLNNGGTIIGGNGGKAGNNLNDSLPGLSSEGGKGVQMFGGSWLSNTSSGTIRGGIHGNAQGGAAAIEVSGEKNQIFNNANILSADESDNAIAIHIRGSDNYLTLLEKSFIKGKVISDGVRNTLTLSGSDLGSFNVSQIGDSGQYRGFANFLKAGEGEWKLSGATKALTPWTVQEGTLSIQSDANLGSSSGILTLDGGTLEFRSFYDDEDDDEWNEIIEIYRPITLTANDGYIDTYSEDGIIYSEIQGEGGLQKLGKHHLVLAAENKYSGGTYVGSGELQIGDGGNTGSIIGNVEVDVGAKLSFNRSDLFEIEHLIAGGGQVVFKGEGNAIWSTNSGDFEGVTTISNGTLTLKGNLGGLISVAPDAVLAGSSTVGALTSNGTIAPGDSNNYGAITILQDYLGREGSIVLLKVALADDNSLNDRLIIVGDADGVSKVSIHNISGSGGDTIRGIEVISVGGDSNATFNLMGDYNLPSGTPAVVAGAHSYVLEKGTAADPTDGNWYLRSHFAHDTPPNEDPDIYQPGIPLYSSYAHIVDRLNTLPTMGERVGNRYWKGSAAQRISQGDGPGGNTEPSTDPALKEVLTDAGLIWARVEAAHNRTQLQNSTTRNKFNSDQWSLRAGIDNQITENAYGKVIAGFWLQYDTAKADISSYFGNGAVNAHSYGVGGALTWLSDDGLYIDGQGRYSWSKSDISSETLNRTLITDAKGSGLALSLEAGQQIAINERWSWTPQGQLTWAQTTLDDFTDPYNAVVSFETLRSLTARIGMSAQYSGTWQDKNGYTTRANAYSITTIYREFLNRSPKMNISDELIYIGNEERTWGELGFGGTYAFLDDKYALFGEAAVASPFKQLGDNYSLRGNVGFRANW